MAFEGVGCSEDVLHEGNITKTLSYLSLSDRVLPDAMLSLVNVMIVCRNLSLDCFSFLSPDRAEVSKQRKHLSRPVSFFIPFQPWYHDQSSASILISVSEV